MKKFSLIALSALFSVASLGTALLAPSASAGDKPPADVKALAAKAPAIPNDAHGFAYEWQNIKRANRGTNNTAQNLFLVNREKAIKQFVKALDTYATHAKYQNIWVAGEVIDAYTSLIHLPDNYGILPLAGFDIAAVAKKYSVSHWVYWYALEDEINAFPEVYIKGRQSADGYPLTFYNSIFSTVVSAAEKRLEIPGKLQATFDAKVAAKQQSGRIASLATGQLSGDYIAWFKRYVSKQDTDAKKVALLRAEIKALGFADSGARRDAVVQDLVTTLQIIQALQ